MAAFLAEDDRYERAATSSRAVCGLLDSWPEGEVVADQARRSLPGRPPRGPFRPPRRPLRYRGPVQPAPQSARSSGHLPGGRLQRRVGIRGGEADAIFSRHATLDAGRSFYNDIKGRLGRYGRRPEQLLILPAATFVLGDTDDEAHDLAHQVRLQQVSGQTAIRFLEQVWNCDLSAYDPDGPLPDFDPRPGENAVARGRASVRIYRDPVATARDWRDRAWAEHLSIRQLMIAVTARQTLSALPRPRGRDQRSGTGECQRRLHFRSAYHPDRTGAIR